jgi:uncharacterized protein YkwD
MREPRHAVSWSALAVVALIVVVAVAPASAGAATARQACPTSAAISSSVKLIKKTELCLHNLERGRAGLSQMRLSSALSAVALAHARDMVKHHYFDHVSPGEKDHMDRIAASSYPPTAGGACWTAGENLLIANGAASALQLMRAWMNSPEHRANVLHRGWRDFGLGVVGTSPDGDPNGLTVVALFGTRSKAVCG